MSYRPIERLEIKNYGCIRETSFALSPLHALIGPNDSGKSTALRAIRTVAQFAAGDFGQHPNQHPIPFDPMIDTNGRGPSIDLSYADGLSYAIWNEQGVYEVAKERGAADIRSDAPRGWNLPGLIKQKEGVPRIAALKERITTATMVRFDPSALRSASRQLLSHEPIQFLHETGGGLASVYQAINSRDVDAFVAIRDRVRKFFPTLQTILVPTVDNGIVVLQARLTDNTIVPATALSEGLLYFLGYLALQYIAESKLFLIEEPENGLHPSRIRDVMSVLREISKRSQVIIATHSPLVINELEGHEVSVVTRHPQQGIQAVLISQSPNFEKRSSVYALGELWLSYADGELEAPLLQGLEQK